MTIDITGSRTDSVRHGPAIGRLSSAQLERGRRRPEGGPAERARAVRSILDAPTFPVVPSRIHHPAWTLGPR